MKASRFGRRGRYFTLVELLVVVAIIIVLVGVLSPGLKSARDLAKRSICLANLRQVGYGHFMYYSDHRRLLPGYDGWGAPYSSNPGTDWGWMMRLNSGASYIDIYHGILYANGYIPKANVFKCPSGDPEKNWWYGSYCYRNCHPSVNVGALITNVNSRKCLVAEKFCYDIYVDNMHRTGYTLLFMDGHVKFYSDPTRYIRSINTNHGNLYYNIWSSFDKAF